ncbi:MAG TPA: hypothetical protein VKH35_16885 [Thermoanaerobaculia bacterium]|nr:hypothetical protein [Thermoanaerobaculia bacterium]
MNEEFIAETAEDDERPVVVGCLSGWEAIVFVIADDDQSEIQETTGPV